jgi:hypothetical protein
MSAPLRAADQTYNDYAAGLRSKGNFWTFVWENDKFGGTDRNYSNGNRISRTSIVVDPNNFAGLVAKQFLGFTESDKTSRDALILSGWAIGQSMFTPEDTTATAPLPNQHPSAGWLYGEYSVLVAKGLKPDEKPSLQSLSLQVGVVGPAAQGEWAQNHFHRLIGVAAANGWVNQLHDELGVVLLYDWRKQMYSKKIELLPNAGRLLQDFGFDIVPSVGFAAGNVLTQASAGATFRVGTHLKNSDLPARVRPSTPGGGLFKGEDKFAWYAFAGFEGRAVAHDIFLDGNTFVDSLRVDRRPWVADFQVGAALRFGQTQIVYTFVTRTKEFETQGTPQQFGSVSITQRFAF